MNNALPKIANYNIVMMMDESFEQELFAIKTFYSDTRAERSQVPLINHIYEGLQILDMINASYHAKGAFCIHPMCQADADLKENYEYLLDFIPSKSIVLAMEYRSVANEYLSKRTIHSLRDIRISPLKEVNDMLIADKIQNYKDFLIYHSDTHPRAEELEVYFKNWLIRLNCLDLFDEVWSMYENG